MATDNRFDNADLIASIPREGAQIQVRKLDGGDVDVRLFVEGEKYTGPTKKGIVLAPGEVDQLVSILTQLAPKPKARARRSQKAS